MLRQETIVINGRQLVKTWSDAGKFIVQSQTGAKYVEAIDIPNKFTYTESEESVPVEGEGNGNS